MPNYIVHIVEDDPDLRASLLTALELEGYIVKVWPSATQLLDNNPPHKEPTVIVTDMRLGDVSGLRMHQTLIGQGKRIPIIYISGESRPSEIIESMKLHPIDFLLKPFSRSSLLQAIQIGISLSKEIIESERIEGEKKKAIAILSPREVEVFNLLSQGKSNSEIVQELRVSLPTAKQYKTQVMRKLNFKSLAELIGFSQSLRRNH